MVMYLAHVNITFFLVTMKIIIIMLIQQKSHRCYEGEKYICVGKLFIKGIVPHTQILPRVLF